VLNVAGFDRADGGRKHGREIVVELVEGSTFVFIASKVHELVRRAITRAIVAKSISGADPRFG
jgi:hypothetical protein